MKESSAMATPSGRSAQKKGSGTKSSGRAKQSPGKPSGSGARTASSKAVSPGPGDESTKGGPATNRGKPGATTATKERPTQHDETRVALPVPPTRAGWAIAAGVFLLTVADIPKFTDMVTAPESAVLIVLGAAGLPLLVARAVGWPWATRNGTETWAARCAIAFVVVGGVSAALAATPVMSVFGQYQQPTGWLFMIALAGVWALGTGIGRAERRLIETALIAGAVVNAVVAILQGTVGLDALDLPRFQAESTGLLGNPVFLGALLAGSLPILAYRVVEQPKHYWAPTALVAVGIAFDAQRLPALLALAVSAWFAWKALRERRGAAGKATTSRPILAFGIGVVVLLVVGSLVAGLRGGGGVIKHALSSTSTETYGQRFDIWKVAAQAFVHRPLLGYGPGRFVAATGPRLSLADATSFGAQRFIDGHNFVVEYATTIGILGLAALLAWIFFSFRHRSGPLVGMAVVIGLIELLEPLNPVVTPLAFFALGAAALDSPQPADQGGVLTDPARTALPPPSWLRSATLILAAVALVAGLLLVIGDGSLRQAEVQNNAKNFQGALVTAGRADALLFPWPEPAGVLATIHYNMYSASGDPDQLAQALYWDKTATERDPLDAKELYLLSIDQTDSGQLAAAYRSAEAAEAAAPGENIVLNQLGRLESLSNRAQAEQWFAMSLAVDGSQPQVAQILQDLRRGCTVVRITPNLAVKC